MVAVIPCDSSWMLGSLLYLSFSSSVGCSFALMAWVTLCSGLGLMVVNLVNWEILVLLLTESVTFKLLVGVLFVPGKAVCIFPVEVFVRSLIEGRRGKSEFCPPRGNRWCMSIRLEPLKLLVLMLFVLSLGLLSMLRMWRVFFSVTRIFECPLSPTLGLRSALSGLGWAKHLVVPYERVLQFCRCVVVVYHFSTFLCPVFPFSPFLFRDYFDNQFW